MTWNNWVAIILLIASQIWFWVNFALELKRDRKERQRIARRIREEQQAARIQDEIRRSEFRERWARLEQQRQFSHSVWAHSQQAQFQQSMELGAQQLDINTLNRALAMSQQAAGLTGLGLARNTSRVELEQRFEDAEPDVEKKSHEEKWTGFGDWYKETSKK